MKIKVLSAQLGGLSPEQWLRRSGYALLVDRQSGETSFARRFSRDFYPRFHLYVQPLPGTDTLFFNLHLDHKRASYVGQTRHSADYDGELVTEEANRLRSLLGQTEVVGASKDKSSPTVATTTGRPTMATHGDVLRSLSAPVLGPVAPIATKRWWQKLFS